MFEQWKCVINIITLTFTNHKIYRIAIGIHYGMDFCACSTSAMSDFVWRPPFFAPALC